MFNFWPSGVINKLNIEMTHKYILMTFYTGFNFETIEFSKQSTILY